MNLKIKILIHYLRFRRERAALYDKELLAKVQKRREEKWRKNLAKSLFYQRWKEADLKEFPRLNKNKHLDHFDRINTAGVTKEKALEIALKAEKTRDFSPTIGNITIGLSSGTSGNHGIFLANPNERAEWVAAILDRVIGWSWKKRKVAFFLRANSNLYEASRSRLLQFEFFDTTIALPLSFDRLNALQPNILIGQPSVLIVLAEARQNGQLTILPAKVISVAEVLDDTTKEQLKKAFGVKIEQVYQCTEGFLAHTCERGNLHLNEDWLIIERRYVDSDKTRFHPVITDLARMTQPVVRYELNDILKEGKPCDCGRVTQVIEKIEGRSDQTFVFDNSEGGRLIVFPDTIRRLVLKGGDYRLKDYQVHQVSRRKIQLGILTYRSDQQELVESSVRLEIANYLDKNHLTDVEIIVVPYKKPKPGSKLIRIKNETQQSL